MKKKTSAPKAAIGVDIGGQSVKLGLVDAAGRILSRAFYKTPSSEPRTRQLDVLIGHCEALRADAARLGRTLTGVGIGAPGPIDVDRGFVYFFPNIPGWKDTPLKAWLQSSLRLPVFVDNDANVMALAEHRFGAGRGCDHLIALTLGTGVGGGIVTGGRLFHGPRYSAAEIGHTLIDPRGPLCGCGNRGCVETFVGTGYFVAAARARLARGARGLLKNWVRQGRELTPLLVAQAAKRGDPLAIGLFEESASRLAQALTGLINTLNPERIIIGGGIAQNGAVLFGPLRAFLKKKPFPIAARSVRVIPAALGTDAGLVGAAAQAFED